MNKYITSEANNLPLCGKIDIRRIPYNEFSEICTGDFPSADTMYHAYQKLYKEKKCIQCSNTWWHKKSDDVESDICWKCRKENIAKLIEQNQSNL